MDRRADVGGAEVGVEGRIGEEFGMTMGGVCARGAAITGWRMHRLGCCRAQLCPPPKSCADAWLPVPQSVTKCKDKAFREVNKVK